MKKLSLIEYSSQIEYQGNCFPQPPSLPIAVNTKNSSGLRVGSIRLSGATLRSLIDIMTRRTDEEARQALLCSANR